MDTCQDCPHSAEKHVASQLQRRHDMLQAYKVPALPKLAAEATKIITVPVLMS